MTVEVETPFLLVYLVEVGEWGEREGGRGIPRERKRRKAGRSILAGKTFEVLFRETIREEGGRCQLSWSC